MTAPSRASWSKQDLLTVAKRQKVLFWLVLMNFLVACVCLGPILAVASAAIGTRLTAQPAGPPAAAAPPTAEPSAAPAPAAVQAGDSTAAIAQPAPEASLPPAPAAPAAPGMWDHIARGLGRVGAEIAALVTAALSYVAWGIVIPASIILSSLITIYCSQRLAAAVRASAAWHYFNPLLMITAAVIVAYHYGRIAAAFSDSEPWAYVVVSTLSLLSLGALFPVVRLDSAATSLLDRHGIAFGALGAKLDPFEPHDLRRFRCPKCQIELFPEEEFWDGSHPRCISCGTVGEPLHASGPDAAPVAAAPAR